MVENLFDFRMIDQDLPVHVYVDHVIGMEPVLLAYIDSMIGIAQYDP